MEHIIVLPQTKESCFFELARLGGSVSEPFMKEIEISLF